MDTGKLKNIFLFIAVILLIPFVQHSTGLFNIGGLKGAISEPQKPTFSIENWFEGIYQNQSETYLNEKFGFRNYFIRLNNQVAYSFYKNVNANGVIMGKEEYLYEESYINAYFGTDFIGKDSIDSVMRKVQFLQHALKKKNIDLILVFNPGKASYFPEYIPNKMKAKKGITNYEQYAQQAKKLNINLLDFKAFFLSQKNTTPFPLFSKCGIHWSTYCETLAADSLMKFIGALRNTPVPEFKIDSIQIENGTKFRDADIKDGMNLIFGPDCGELAYPLYHILEKDRIKLNCITISDSFYWGIYGRKEIKQLFANAQFWYYYNEFYNPDWDKVKTVSEIDIKSEMEKQHVILIMATEATLPKLGWGFIQAAYSLYKSEE